MTFVSFFDGFPVVERAPAQYVDVGLPVLSNVLCWDFCVRPAGRTRTSVYCTLHALCTLLRALLAGRAQGTQHRTLLITGARALSTTGNP